MPSLPHEELVELLRREPTITIEALRRARILELPAYTSLEICPGEIRELLPTERRVDVVILLRDDVPVFVLLVEVQLGIDPDKPLTWPLYVVALRAEYRCPAALVVFSPHEHVRTWAAARVETGQPGFSFTPCVLGPSDIPRVTDPSEAEASPYRAILSALVHADEPDVAPVMIAAFHAAAALPAPDVHTWRELLAIALQSNDVARRTVESMMDIENFRDRSVWFKEGRDLGREGGLREGALAYARSAVERILNKRGLVTTDAQRARIERCEDLALLDRWLEAAAVARSADEALAQRRTSLPPAPPVAPGL